MAKDLKVPLLPKPAPPVAVPRSITAPVGNATGKSLLNVNEVKKRGKGVRSWIRVDNEGNSHALEADKATIMRRCGLPARDLRLLDPHFTYPATILGREKALVLNLEHIRCIITADEVLLLSSFDKHVLQYVSELQRRLAIQRKPTQLSELFSWRPPGVAAATATSSELPFQEDQSFWGTSSDDRQEMGSDVDMFTGSSEDYLPFEFRALEVALEFAWKHLDTEVTRLESEAYPVLDELVSKISTLNLERVRRLKSRLVGLTRRVQKIREEIEQLMDDDGDMADMYLTSKAEEAANFFQVNNVNLERNNSMARVKSGIPAISMSAPVSPASSPQKGTLEKTWSIARSFADTASKASRGEEDVEELEMLLEAYFVLIDGTLNKLTALKEYIEDTEDFINIQLDNVRNQLIQFELLLTTATFVVAIWGIVAGIFGMNFPILLFEDARAFKWVLGIAGTAGLLVFGSFLWFYRRMRLLP